MPCAASRNLREYPTTGTLLPAMGYGEQQQAVCKTIEKTCDVVVVPLLST